MNKEIIFLPGIPGGFLAQKQVKPALAAKNKIHIHQNQILRCKLKTDSKQRTTIQSTGNKSPVFLKRFSKKISSQKVCSTIKGHSSQFKQYVRTCEGLYEVKPKAYTT